MFKFQYNPPISRKTFQKM